MHQTSRSNQLPLANLKARERVDSRLPFAITAAASARRARMSPY